MDSKIRTIDQGGGCVSNTIHKVIAALVYITIGLALISFCSSPDDGHNEPENQQYERPEQLRP